MTSPNNLFTTGQVMTSAEANNFPFGVCGVQTLTTQFTTSDPHTTAQDTGMTLTINEIAGRRYLITAQGNCFPSGGLQSIRISIRRAGTDIKVATYSSAVLDTNVGYTYVLPQIFTATTTGSATYTVQMRALTNNTAVADFGSATSTRQFLIQDIGTS
jgi:hypothetical protein